MTINIRHDVPGAQLCTLQVGGPCATVIEVTTQAELQQVLLGDSGAICIGGGSNLLVSDAGVATTLVRYHQGPPSEIVIDIDSGRMQVGGAVSWDDLVTAAIAAGLQGLESTSGIPGTVGGAIVQNVGAYGQEIADVVQSVTVFDRVECRIVELVREQCRFSYRSSVFKHDPTRRFVVLAAELALQHATTAMPRYGDVAATLLKQSESGSAGLYPLPAIRSAVLEVRAGKGMVLGASAPSAGSFFTNPEVAEANFNLLDSALTAMVLGRSAKVVRLSAAALMEAAGYRRGFRHGNVGLSERHVLAVVNLGGATATELVDFTSSIVFSVAQRFGVILRPEPVLLGFAGNPFAQAAAQAEVA